MKKRAASLFFVIVLLLCMFDTTSIYAKSRSNLSKPKIGKWMVTYDGDLDPDIYHRVTGMTHTIKWKKVKGASGYQVCISYKGYTAPSLKYWSTPKYIRTKRLRTDVGHSGYTEIRAKVRAYTLKKGRIVYGPWSKMVKTRTKYFPKRNK